MSIYDTIVSALRSFACLEATSSLELVPTGPIPWSSLELRDVWKLRVFARLTFHFESKLAEQAGPQLAAIDIGHEMFDNADVQKSVDWALANGATLIAGGWLRFEVSIIQDEFLATGTLNAYLFQLSRRGSEYAAVGSGRIPVTIWANAAVKAQTAINARSRGEATMRALRGKPDWSVHSILPDALSQPQALAGPEAKLAPPKFQQKSCLNCGHCEVYTSFVGTEVTPPEISRRCMKKMTMPIGMTATFCPGWEEGEPKDDTDSDAEE